MIMGQGGRSSPIDTGSSCCSPNSNVHMLATYPELFAGGAIIAGLPSGAPQACPKLSIACAAMAG